MENEIRINYTTAASRLGVSVTTIGRWVASGKLIPVASKNGTAKYVTLDSVTYLENDKTFMRSVEQTKRKVSTPSRNVTERIVTLENEVAELRSVVQTLVSTLRSDVAPLIRELTSTLKESRNVKATKCNVKENGLNVKESELDVTMDDPPVDEMRMEIIAAVQRGVPKHALCKGTNTKNVDNIISGKATAATIRYAYGKLKATIVNP